MRTYLENTTMADTFPNMPIMLMISSTTPSTIKAILGFSSPFSSSVMAAKECKMSRDFGKHQYEFIL